MPAIFPTESPLRRWNFGLQRVITHKPMSKRCPRFVGRFAGFTGCHVCARIGPLSAVGSPSRGAAHERGGDDRRCYEAGLRVGPHRRSGAQRPGACRPGSLLASGGRAAGCRGRGSGSGRLGSPEAQPPDLGRQVYRLVARVDDRARVVLDRRVRAWLAVSDAGSFQAVTLPLGWTCEGLLVVPPEGHPRRFEG
jgi:hypothetical protein